MMLSPGGAVVWLPAAGMKISVAEEPFFAAAGAVLVTLVFAWPGYMLLSATGRALFDRPANGVVGLTDGERPAPPTQPAGPARVSWLAVGSAICSIPAWVLVLGLLTKLYDSLKSDGLPPSDFTIGIFELLVLGTGGFVGLAALFLGRDALREIRSSTGKRRGARLAAIGLLGIPVGLLIKFLPPLLGSLTRSLGWQPSARQGELCTAAVLVGILLLAARAAWGLRRWAKGGAAAFRPNVAV